MSTDLVWMVWDLSEDGRFGDHPDSFGPKFGPMTEYEADLMVSRNPRAYWKQHVSAVRVGT
jgi:hypothetical protein